MDPLRSTYLDLRLSHILWKVADDDLAVASGLAGHCGRGSRSPRLGSVLLDAASWCSDGGFGLGLRGAWHARATTTAAGWLAGVFHDLVEGLVELPRHGDCVWCVVGKCWLVLMKGRW